MAREAFGELLRREAREAAVEVLDDSRAVDRASVELLYERIGYRVSANVFETSDAQTAERQVYRELSRCKM